MSGLLRWERAELLSYTGTPPVWGWRACFCDRAGRLRQARVRPAGDAWALWVAGRFRGHFAGLEGAQERAERLARQMGARVVPQGSPDRRVA